ncbi:MAG: hypothetical protein JXR96_05625 [Deltaproteobacteria bacterium]|nr:hypothetical protein [Deltaproteobacteria bacterium]
MRAYSIRLLLLSMLLIGCAERSEGKTPELARPDGRTGDAPAALVAAMGEVRIQPVSGEAFRAQPGVRLYRDDRIQVSQGGLAVVHLVANGYLARIDEGVDLPVSGIYLLDAPKASESLADQFEALLDPRERQNAERMVGWQVRMAGGQTEGYKREESETQDAAKSLTALPPGGPRGGGPVKSSKSFPGGGSFAEGGALADEEAAPDTSSALAEEKEKDRSSKRTVRRKPGLKRERKALPAWLQKLRDDPALRACLQAALERYGLELDRIQVRIKLAGGKAIRIALGGGLPVPACARDLAVKLDPGKAADGWYAFEIHLARR